MTLPVYVFLALTWLAGNRHYFLTQPSMPPGYPLSQVPELWARYAYPSLKPFASWIKDYHLRVSFMHTWLIQGSPTCFWLPGFFFPQVGRARGWAGLRASFLVYCGESVVHG